MAEGLARALKSETIEPYSAGILKHTLDPRAVRVMQEIGIDISKQYSKTIDELKGIKFDYVVTLCGHAHETCPYFPGKVIHRGFPDPPSMAVKAKSEEEALNFYREVRDKIKEFVLSLPESLEE
jgi:arsenate reductase